MKNRGLTTNWDQITRGAKEAFWSVVKDCLVQFHDLEIHAAEKKARTLRQKVEGTAEDHYLDIFYHAEPFDVACDIAEHQLDLSEYYPKYKKLLVKYNW